MAMGKPAKRDLDAPSGRACPPWGGGGTTRLKYQGHPRRQAVLRPRLRACAKRYGGIEAARGWRGSGAGAVRERRGSGA